MTFPVVFYKIGELFIFNYFFGMTIYAVRRENETVEKLINRFKKQVQTSRLVLKVKSQRYWTRNITDRLVRMSALKREEYRAKRRREQFAN